MPIIKIHCPHCATEFVDARSEVRAGDEAMCPHCGARYTFEAGIPGAGPDIEVPTPGRDAASEDR